MKKIVALTLTIIIAFCFSSCSIKDKDIEVSTTTTTSIDENTIHIKNAEKSMKDYLSYYNLDISEVNYNGFYNNSGITYVVYQAKNTPEYSYYVNLNENYNIYGGYDGSEMDLVWENNSNTQPQETYTEKQKIQNLLEVISPIADYTMLRKVADFYNIAVPTVISSNSCEIPEQLYSIQIEVYEILDAVIEAEIPEGYALQDNWNELVATCNLLKNNLSNALKALNDKDSNRLLELQDIAGNTNIVKKAIGIQNILSEELNDIEKNNEKANIVAEYTYSECKAKAAKYARYYFEDSTITENDINGTEKTVIFEDVPGKHYSFTYSKNENIIILIDVENCTIICREMLSKGYIDNYVNDGVLPAEANDVAMPDIIGMDYKEAITLLESLGITYDESSVDTDRVPEGTVAHCYPSPGNAVPDDYVVSIAQEIETTE